MRQLLQLKTKPQDAVLTEDLFGLDPTNESFGQSTELRDLLSNLFTSSFLLELKEETKSLDIALDEEEKKLILKFKKKTKSKSLAKRGQTYALRNELKMTSLTLVYNYRPDYETQNELQPIIPIEPTMNLVKPLEVAQPKTMMPEALKLPIKPQILVDNMNDITIVLPLPEYTDNLLQELSNIAYEEKFRPLTNGDNYLETNTVLDTGSYRLGPEKVRREDLRPENLVQEYGQVSTLQTQKQNVGQLGGVIHNVYKNPIERDGELFHEEYRFASKRLTTAYQAMLDSGLRISSRYSRRFGGEYIMTVNGSGERDGTYWEIKVNGHYIPVTADKYMVPPGAEISLVRKTARSNACGETMAG